MMKYIQMGAINQAAETIVHCILSIDYSISLHHNKVVRLDLNKHFEVEIS